ncbi:MAG TPA: hypothetical protein VFQ61_39475, partial [Polyangiaceae bacterium]|nr:hypothetical protein [Polyangiaceae bacterium]
MKRTCSLSLMGWVGTLVLGCTGTVSDPGAGATGGGAGTPNAGQPNAGATHTTVNPDGSTTTTKPDGTTVTTMPDGSTVTMNPDGTTTTTPPGTGSGGTPGTGSIEPGDVTQPATPFEAVTALTSVRKVKNLMTGLAPTDAEVQAVAERGAAGLQELIGKWMNEADTQPKFRDKMLQFFRNAFQQTGFIPTEDFKHQLLENGGFDFGPLGTGAVGDDIYFRLVQNIQDSFAMTAWQFVVDGRPFSEVLTTDRFMMTTALKAVYVQIEMPNDQPYASFGQSASNFVKWSINMAADAVIPIETVVGNRAALQFDDQKPAGGGSGFSIGNTCQGTDVVKEYSGYAQLFQRLIGYTPRNKFVANPECWEHASKPYFQVTDTQDWQWVKIKKMADGESYIYPYDIPALRTASELSLKMPRVGFFTTPAFLALWNTNDSNQHRVTANQTLLVALGVSYTPEAAFTPASVEGLAVLDKNHSVEGSECYACHRGLDPL